MRLKHANSRISLVKTNDEPKYEHHLLIHIKEDYNAFLVYLLQNTEGMIEYSVNLDNSSASTTVMRTNIVYDMWIDLWFESVDDAIKIKFIY